MKQLITFIALLLLITAAGCREQASSPSEETIEASEAITAWPATRKTDQGNFSVTVKPIDGQIERNRHFSLEITIEPISDGELEIKVDADMPAHRHGMNTKPGISATGEHAYQADGMLFHMGGDWVITVDVTHKGDTERASFPVLIE